MGTTPLIEEEDKIEGKPLENGWFVLLRIGIALALITALLYSSGIHDYLLFRKTPDSIEQASLQSAIEAPILTVPLTVMILSNNEESGSQRSEDDALRLVENASRIWEQAGITLHIQRLEFEQKTDEELNLFFQSPREFIQNIDGFNSATINVFLVGHLGGLNGIAFGGVQSVAIADYTTVHNFRTLAHEIGHILRLDHVKGDEYQLMFQGSNGFSLSLEEIMQARNAVETLFGE